MATFLTAQEAAERIPDGATVGLAGMGLSGWPEEVACAIRDRFRETGHPRNLNLKQGSAMGDWGYGNQFLGWDRTKRPDGPAQDQGNRGVTRFGEAGEGLIAKWCGAHIGSAFSLNELVRQNKIQCHCLPQGVIVNLWREIAAGRPGLLTKVGLGDRVDYKPAELSGGQQQRVAIARTLAPKPTVLFMDEPLSNLDAKLRLEMRYELQRLHVETGSTFVYVTHDQMEAMTLATQICLIENGVLQQYDAPLTVYHQPNNLFVADFVGNPSINFVEAKGAQRADGAVELTVFQGRKALFRPSTPLDLSQWFRDRSAQAAAREEAHRKRAAEKSYVEKGNKDEAFRYHIAKVVEDDDSLQDDPVLTDQDLVLGIRPEFLDIADQSPLEGEIYGAMPTGMESTIKVRVDDFLLTGVIFGSSLFTIGEKVPVTVSGDNIMLFHRKSGACIATGSLEL